MKLNQMTLPANNIAESKRFYGRLGLRFIVDTAEYARFELPEGEATLSLSYRSHPVLDDEEGIHIHFECDNLDANVLQSGRSTPTDYKASTSRPITSQKLI